MGVVAGDRARLPFPGSHFDAVVLARLFYLMSDWQAVLREAHDALKPGGHDKQCAVEQCRACPLPGYLLVWPTTKARTLSEIPPDLVGKLGRLLQRVVGALESVLALERIYILQFGEET